MHTIIVQMAISWLFLVAHLVIANQERQQPSSYDFMRGTHLESYQLHERGRRNIEMEPIGRNEPSLIQRETMCSSCVDRQVYLNFTKEEIRKNILRKLGLESPPQVSVKDIPQHLVRELIRKFSGDLQMMGDDPFAGQAATNDDDDDDEFFQPKGISLRPHDPVGKIPETLTDEWDIQYYSLADLSQLRDGNWRQVGEATVSVHLPKAPSDRDTEAWIHLFYVQLTKNNEASLVQSKAIRVELFKERGGWVDIDAMEIAKIWFKHPAENLGLVLNVVTKSGYQLPVGIQHQSDEHVPHLNLKFNGKYLNNRMKRTANRVCSEEHDQGEERCCLWPFTVDFEKEYGWTFVIYPTEYEANYCSGNCTLGVMMPSNPYAHLVQQSKGNPCCTPQKMSGINMLYFDKDSNVVLGHLPKMKVERCGCA